MSELIRFIYTDIDGISYYIVKPRGEMTEAQVDDYAISLGVNPSWTVIPAEYVIWSPVPAPVGMPLSLFWEGFVQAMKEQADDRFSPALNDEKMPIFPEVRRTWTLYIVQCIEKVVANIKAEPLVSYGKPH